MDTHLLPRARALEHGCMLSLAPSPTPSSTPARQSTSDPSAGSSHDNFCHSTTQRRSKTMRVFVTGGTGHAGSHIIPDLVAAGHEVTALVRSDSSVETVSALGGIAR